MILVSNRLPVTIRKSGGKISVSRSSGGLVAGLAPIHDESDSWWVGNAGNVRGAEQELRERRLVPVELGREEARRHYEGHSNQVLWPLFHYLIEHVEFQRADFEAYRRVNEAFADAVCELARPDETIWVHDYQLMLLPSILRERLPDASIAFFLHIPFPSSEVFRILPRKEEILAGLLGADLIGLHTYDYGRHLVSSFRRVLGVEFDDDWVRARDGRCKVGVFPLGVDTASLEELARSPAVERKVERMRRRLAGRRVVLGVDRMDYTKGLRLRLRAFRRLLELEPEWRTDAVLMQLAVPSRSNIASYRVLKQEVERQVGELNGAFGAQGVVPVEYMHRSVPLEELAAMYRVADVAWVTPVRDGMNLVAKEYVAHRINDDGALVLSEFAGAASEMGEALQHNPYDIDGSAKVLDTALRMDSHEQARHMRALRRRVRANDVHRWVRRFLRALDKQRTHRAELEVSDRGAEPRSAGWEKEVLAAVRSAKRRLIALDYDGTLTELVPRPEEAEPGPELIELLSELGARDDVELVVISGRDPETLGAWLGQTGAHLVAEHGLHCRIKGESEWEVLLAQVDMSWKDAVREILEDYSSRTPGAFVEEKSASLAWHYRQAELSFGSWQAREMAQHLSEAFANSALEVLHGSKVVEVRPQGFDKGRAITILLERLGPFDYVLAAGDDRTDEDMFAALDDTLQDTTHDTVHDTAGATVKIGRGATHARYRMDAPATLLAFLSRI